nr:histidine kinase [Streptomyces spiramenti]
MSALRRYQGKGSRVHVRHYTYSALFIFYFTEVWLVGVWFFAIADLAELPARLLLLAIGWSHMALTVVTGHRALESYVDGTPWPSRLFNLLLALTLVAVAYGLILVATGRTNTEAAVTLAWFPMFFAGPALLLPSLWRGIATTALPAAVAWLSLMALDVTGDDFLTAVLWTLGGCAFVGFTFRSSGWILRVMEELHAARETQSRLAVAEERLRFGRDMHDVLGRNLSVIALKSELAVQLAQRGSAAAGEQMAEVQRIAHESQREMRAVLRGYRVADLNAEIAGARGVLEAAGIRCTVAPVPSTALPREVSEALGWVVREGATNVLRHSEATRCTLRLELRTSPGEGGEEREAPRRGRLGLGARRVPAAQSEPERTAARRPTAVLTMENNGAPVDAADGTSSGSGLTGLAERLASVGGTVTAEAGKDGTFVLVGRVPMPSPDAAGQAESADGSAGPGRGRAGDGEVAEDGGEGRTEGERNDDATV